MHLRGLQLIPLILVLMVSVSGCRLIGDIFKIGFWSALILAGIAIFVVWMISRLFSGRRRV